MVNQDNLFNFGQFKYLKWGLCLLVLAGLLYAMDQPRIVANGGTPLGYALGTVGAMLIVWLMALGVRKRKYGSTLGQYRGWVSAHIYLGLSLILIGTLHTGFQLGWNVHSLAYVLMMLTIFSGVWGLGLYIKNPKEMSDVLDRQSPEELVAKVDELDSDAAKMEKNLQSNGLKTSLAQSLQQGLFNGSLERLSGRVKSCSTEHLVGKLQNNEGEDPTVISALYQNQAQRLKHLRQLRKHYSQKLWMDLWLTIHVPLSFGLLAALGTHIFSVFFYW